MWACLSLRSAGSKTVVKKEKNAEKREKLTVLREKSGKRSATQSSGTVGETVMKSHFFFLFWNTSGIRECGFYKYRGLAIYLMTMDVSAASELREHVDPERRSFQRELQGVRETERERETESQLH